MINVFRALKFYIFADAGCLGCGAVTNVPYGYSEIFFRAVGEWFATGVRPQMTFSMEFLPDFECSLPSSLVVNDAAAILIPQRDTEVPPSVRLWKYKTDFILLAEMSAPDLSYGLRAGVKGRTSGCYLALRSDFHQSSSRASDRLKEQNKPFLCFRGAIVHPKEQKRPFCVYEPAYRFLGLICGKKSTSWMVGELVMNIVRRSIPIPSPDVGGIPYSSARTKSISMNIASSSPLSLSFT